MLALDADAVDEEVERAEALGDGIDAAADVGDGVRIHREAGGVVAGFAELRCQRFGLVGAAAGDGNARARRCQRTAERIADRAVATGHESDATLQREQRLERGIHRVNPSTARR